MELETVKLCFKKYINYLEKNGNCHNYNEFSELSSDVETLTIQDIDRITQTTFMDYVINQNDKINQLSIPCTLYKHTNSLIRQYMQDESNKTISKLNDIIFKLNDDCESNNSKKKLITNQILPQSQISEPAQVSKGWFF